MTKVTMPSPQYREQDFPCFIETGPALFDAVQMEAYAAAKVREVLEEAARAVAGPVLIEATIENFYWASAENHDQAHRILIDAQQAIRALIPS